jgi:histidinol-phosphate aminotransferase
MSADPKPPVPRPLIAAASLPPLPSAEREGKLRLDMNENQWGPSPRALAALVELEGNQGQRVAAYGFSDRLRQRLAEIHAVSPEEIVLTAGADEAISALFDAYMDPGEAIVLAWPTFVTFALEAASVGARVVGVPYAADLAFPRGDFLDRVRQRPRLAAIINPGNPAGSAVDLDFVAQVCREAADSLVVVDEAYYDYHGETALSLNPRPANLVVIRTFSKAYGLAGLRVGYALAHREVIDSLRKVLPPFSVSVAGLAAALGTLEDPWHLSSHVETLRREMKLLVAALEERGFPTRSTRANFVLVRVGARAPELTQALAERGILVADRSSDAGLAGFLRITVGRPEQNLQLLGALEAEVTGLG